MFSFEKSYSINNSYWSLVIAIQNVVINFFYLKAKAEFFLVYLSIFSTFALWPTSSKYGINPNNILDFKKNSIKALEYTFYTFIQLVYKFEVISQHQFYKHALHIYQKDSLPKIKILIKYNLFLGFHCLLSSFTLSRQSKSKKYFRSLQY